MKTKKTRNKEITKQYLSNKSIRSKDRAINLIVFAIVSFITVLLIWQIV